jgi:VWFA-related protein
MKISRFAALYLACAFAAFAQSPAVQAPSGQPAARPPYTLGSAPGQSPSGATDDNSTVTFHSNVPLVVLDIVVTDTHGAPVTNLTRAEFHVQEAGEPQSILNFEQAGARVPSPALTIDSTADLDRVAPEAPVQIIVLDEFNTRFEDMAFARYSLKKFLQKQPGKLSTPTMLIAVDLRHFTVLHDYTQNKDDIISSLNHHFSAYPWQAHQGAWIAERYATAFITLRRVAQAVMGHPGHKNMIWIGRGFPPFNLVNAPIDTSNRLNNAVQECVNILRDARVTLYTIDPAGVMADAGKYGEDARFNDPLGGNYQFAELARATGGNSLYGRNDVDAEINSAIKDGASFYTLTYRPTNSSLDPQKFRKITVALDRPGLKVLTRQGYFLRYGQDKVNPANPSRRLVADLIAADSSNMAYDGVPFTVARSTDDPGVFLIHISPQGLYWTPAVDTELRHTDFVMVMSTFDKKGQELHREAKTFKIPASGDVPAVGPLDRSIEIKYHVTPDPKAVRARFTVRVTGSGRIGTQDAVFAPSK